MPKVVTNEIDYSGSSAVNRASTAVFVPGLLGNGAPSGNAGKILFAETESEFKSLFGNGPAEVSESFDKSWIMAHQIVKMGLPVYYVGFASTVALTEALADDDFWAQVKDRGLFDIRFITLGATTGATYAAKAVEAAAGRGDAVALIDHPEELVNLVAESGGTSIPGYFDEVKSTLAVKDNLKFAAGFTPWCYCDGIAKSEGVTDSEDFAMPASFVYLGAFAKSIVKNKTWLAAAGAYRGLCSFDFIPKVNFGDAAVDALQSREAGKLGINPICNVRPFSYIVYGNRTLLENASDEIVDGGLVASSFLNIRHLACELKKRMYAAARKLTFEPNDDLLFNAFCAEVQPLIDQMKSGRGIRGGRIIKIATKAKAVIKAKVRVIPIEDVEDFYLDLELADSLDIAEE